MINLPSATVDKSFSGVKEGIKSHPFLIFGGFGDCGFVTFQIFEKWAPNTSRKKKPCEFDENIFVFGVVWYDKHFRNHLNQLQLYFSLEEGLSSSPD